MGGWSRVDARRAAQMRDDGWKEIDTLRYMRGFSPRQKRNLAPRLMNVQIMVQRSGAVNGGIEATACVTGGSHDRCATGEATSVTGAVSEAMRRLADSLDHKKTRR